MLTYAAVVLGVGLAVTPVAIAALGRLQVLDVPNHRSSHARPTVRGAGVGVGVVAVAVLAVAAGRTDQQLLVVAAAAVSFGVVGFVDDLRGLSVRYRLPIQFLIALAVTLAASTLEPAYLVPVAVLGVVGYLNAFNFMDGINGISGLHAAAIGLTWAMAGSIEGLDAAVLLGGILAAAALAFLPFNFPHARGFLGDVGSYFFGGWIAVSAVVLYGRVPLLIIGLPLVPYIADTTWTLVRRIRRGEVWHEAHREHVYQRLVSCGWSHGQSAGLVAALTLAGGGLALTSEYVFGVPLARVVAVLLAIASAVAYLALPARLEGSGQQETLA